MGAAVWRERVLQEMTEIERHLVVGGQCGNLVWNKLSGFYRSDFSNGGFRA